LVVVVVFPLPDLDVCAYNLKNVVSILKYQPFRDEQNERASGVAGCFQQLLKESHAL